MFCDDLAKDDKIFLPCNLGQFFSTPKNAPIPPIVLLDNKHRTPTGYLHRNFPPDFVYAPQGQGTGMDCAYSGSDRPSGHIYLHPTTLQQCQKNNLCSGDQSQQSMGCRAETQGQPSLHVLLLSSPWSSHTLCVYGWLRGYHGICFCQNN